jgi:hypothetical protein
VHVAPACTGYGEGSDHFGSYVHSISLHFCERLFPGLEPMTFPCIFAQGMGKGHKETALLLLRQGSLSYFFCSTYMIVPMFLKSYLFT